MFSRDMLEISQFILNSFVIAIESMNGAPSLCKRATESIGVVERTRFFDGGGRRFFSEIRKALYPEYARQKCESGNALIKAKPKSLLRAINIKPAKTFFNKLPSKIVVTQKMMCDAGDALADRYCFVIP